MPTTKKTVAADKLAAEQKPGPREIRPTRDDARDALVWLATHTPLVGVSWGATATGKTYMWSHYPGWELITVLLAQHTPDEIAGFQAVVNGHLEVQMPYWFRNAETLMRSGKKVILLFDELSLARDEVKGALYTFFRDRHLHGHRLPGTTVADGMNPNLMVVAATNPGVIAPPFMSRSVIIPIPATRDYLLGIAKTSWAKRVAAEGPITDDSDAAWSDQPPPEMLTVHAATIDTMNRMDRSFYNLTEGAQHLILSGLLPKAVYEQMYRERVDMSALAEFPEEISKHLQQLSAPDAVAMSLELLETLDAHDPKTRSLLLFHLLDGIWRGSEEHVEAYYSTQKSARAMSAVEGADPAYLDKLITDSKVVWFKEESGQMVLYGPWVEPYKEVAATK